MCDVCSDLLALLHSHDERMQDGDGLHLSKSEVLTVLLYVQVWQQRQCMCCYKDYKNYERLNNVVQVIMNLAIACMQSLPEEQVKQQQLQQEKDVGGDQQPDKNTKIQEPKEKVQSDVAQKEEKPVKSAEAAEQKQVEVCDKTDGEAKEEEIVTEVSKSEEEEKKAPTGTTNQEPESKEKNGKEKDDEKAGMSNSEKAEDSEKDSGKCQGEVDNTKSSQDVKSNPEICDKETAPSSADDSNRLMMDLDAVEHWTLDEKDRLLQFVAKVFLMNFPLYVAYKHSVHSSLEELSQQEASALSNYCELADPEIPVYLLRNVCFFCDSNGIQAVSQCFHRVDPHILPYTLAHTLITIIANLRLWMNIATVMQCIVPLRTSVIRYMCKLSDKDLRMAGTRNMTDLMWAAVKEPLETHISFDKEGLDLAFKYFTCSTLTIRLAGITQINNQINLYNEIAQNENLMEADRIGSQLANWLTENKIIEHIFGPNLHVELIKQSQIILNFLAIEGRISNEHIDCIWAAGQLKHCSRQAHDIMIPLIKNLEIQPAQHLLQLVSTLEPVAHTEQTLYLASALIKYLWNTAAAAQTHAMARHHERRHPHTHQPRYAPIIQERQDVETGVPQEHSVHDVSSSEHSDSDGESGEGIEPGQGPCQGQRSMEGNHQKERSEKVKGMEGVEEGERPHGGEEEEDEEGGESGDSSLCANSELSNISDESLPTDMSGQEEDEEGHAHHRCHKHGHLRQRRKPRCQEESDSEFECSEDGKEVEHMEEDDEDEELEELGHRVYVHHGHRHLHHHGHNLRHAKHLAGRMQQEEDTSEEEEEEEDEDDDDEEDEEGKVYYDSDDRELMKHVKVVRVRHGHCHGHEGKESEEDSEECSSEECEEHGVECMHYSLRHQPRRPMPSPKRGVHRTRKQVTKQHAERQLQEAKQKAAAMKKAEAGEEKGKEKVDQKTDRKKEPQEKPGGTEKEGQADAAKAVQNAGSEGELVQVQAGSSGQSGGQMMISQSSQDTEVEQYDCTEYINHMTAHRQPQLPGEYIEDIMSPEDGSCNSSHISNKSEKNMADFEGEDELSDDELVHINTHARYGAQHMQRHLASMASIYRKCRPEGRRCTNSPDDNTRACRTFRFEDVCKRGNTLLWDLVQEDTACLLPEGLASEAEKALMTLVCLSTDRRIRTKFIEACIENVANHRSVLISLRLLPKLFGSFQQYRSGMDTYAVTMWAERELHMMHHFFNHLVFYTNAVKQGRRFPHALYSYKEEIQVHLQFLTCVFSSGGSPDAFRLSLEQVDALWNCLATDPECSDDCFSWFLNQAKNKDHHAMGLETFKHIFIEKMPTLRPENLSMIGLNLFTARAIMRNSVLGRILTSEIIMNYRAKLTQVAKNSLRSLNTPQK